MQYRYEYNLDEVVVRDIVPCQEGKLLGLGFVWNDRMKTWDLYEEQYSEETYVDVEYLEEREEEVQLNEYEIQSIDNNVYRVSYVDKRRQKGFFGFFRKVFSVRTKEERVTDDRFEELLSLQAEGEIDGLEKTITPMMRKERRSMTEKEFLKLVREGTQVRQIRENVGTKTETTEIRATESVRKEEYEGFAEGKEIVTESERKERILKDKILVDQREVAEYNYQYYQPGVWSRISPNHDLGTLANFVAKVRIRYITGFNPFDPDCLNEKEITREIREIIKSERPQAVYIEQRIDERNWFDIDKPRIK